MARASAMLTLAWFASSSPVYAIAGSVPTSNTAAVPLAMQNLIEFIAVSILRGRGNSAFVSAHEVVTEYRYAMDRRLNLGNQHFCYWQYFSKVENRTQVAEPDDVASKSI